MKITFLRLWAFTRITVSSASLFTRSKISLFLVQLMKHVGLIPIQFGLLLSFAAAVVLHLRSHTRTLKELNDPNFLMLLRHQVQNLIQRTWMELPLNTSKPPKIQCVNTAKAGISSGCIIHSTATYPLRAKAHGPTLISSLMDTFDLWFITNNLTP